MTGAPTGLDQLLRIDDVWVRRTATACFPNVGDPLSSAAALQDFVVIETGGEDHEEKFDSTSLSDAGTAAVQRRVMVAPALEREKAPVLLCPKG
jgi:hypothetical protein